MSKLRENFETFYNELIKTKSLFDTPLKEFLFEFYKQGHIDPTDESEELTMEQVKKIVDDNCFVDFVKSCIENPTDKQMQQEDYVEIYYPCTPDIKAKCLAWPDRCEDVGGDGETCGKKIINLSKLCGVSSSEKLKSRITKEEVDALASVLAKMKV